MAEQHEANQPEARQVEVDERRGTRHHYRIHHYLTMQDLVANGGQDDSGGLENWTSPNPLRLKILRNSNERQAKISRPGGYCSRST